ncbi:hypothetical protein DB30_02705 [Enhygromyxa salina]|uniref:Uncharacterized protein n=1 Tax=Enhygromyxa salina TaxID=215803 RepID=A0A0C1ZP97_9BACT|nr:hypothetical protein DB30_02705 [Enhygromyxa salina]
MPASRLCKGNSLERPDSAGDRSWDSRPAVTRNTPRVDPSRRPLRRHPRHRTRDNLRLSHSTPRRSPPPTPHICICRHAGHPCRSRCT